jgi:hypothetical protein
MANQFEQRLVLDMFGSVVEIRLNILPLISLSSR